MEVGGNSKPRGNHADTGSLCESPNKQQNELRIEPGNLAAVLPTVTRTFSDIENDTPMSKPSATVAIKPFPEMAKGRNPVGVESLLYKWLRMRIGE